MFSVCCESHPYRPPGSWRYRSVPRSPMPGNLRARRRVCSSVEGGPPQFSQALLAQRRAYDRLGSEKCSFACPCRPESGGSGDSDCSKKEMESVMKKHTKNIVNPCIDPDSACTEVDRTIEATFRPDRGGRALGRTAAGVGGLGGWAPPLP